jgi:hypothetical protein
MNKLSAVVIIGLLNLSFSHAAEIIPSDSSYYECAAFDNAYNKWVAQNSYERTAINKVLGDCKAISPDPKSCHVAKEDCAAIINGINTRPMWQCVALDLVGRDFKSTIYTQRDDAALGAKAFCIEHSGMPESCYINLLTCENKNKFVH